MDAFLRGSDFRIFNFHVFGSKNEGPNREKRASDTATPEWRKKRQQTGSDNDNERKKERQEDSLEDFKAIVVTVKSEGTTCLGAA